MRRKRLLWHLFPPFLLITVISLLALTSTTTWYLHQFYLHQKTDDLGWRARLAALAISIPLQAGDDIALEARCKSMREGEEAARITVILRDGRVIGDSHEDPARMENHADRPEVQAALRGETGVDIRFSHTLHERMIYCAIPLMQHGQRIGAIRAAAPITTLEHTFRTVWHTLFFGCLVFVVLAACAALWMSRRITHPLEMLKRGAQRFERGEFDARLPVPDSEEIGEVAEAMNQMAASLDERIRTIIRQRNEQEAVLAGMTEGVLAIDREERVFKVNRAAARLLGATAEQAVGRNLYEVIRNPDLQRFAAMVLASREPLEVELLLPEDGNERIMQAHGTLLRDEEERCTGAVIVLTDVTRLRRLERIRRDFVANVSHELKTPITSIKGFTETLLDGAMHNPDDAERFLRIIERHADRLEAIIEDLLSLSRIEQEAGDDGIPLEECRLYDLLHGAMQTCELMAAARKIPVSLDCSLELRLRVSPALLEQAVTNLLDNAIKYSEPGNAVVLSAQRTDTAVTISVSDHGPGIAPDHLARLFERFYRVDKGRSRKLGGTGLGLAIVKHIAQAHGGFVTVDSAVGHGSTFTLHLPRHESAETSIPTPLA